MFGIKAHTAVTQGPPHGHGEVGAVNACVFERRPDPAIPQGIVFPGWDDLTLDLFPLCQLRRHVPCGVQYFGDNRKGAERSPPGGKADGGGIHGLQCPRAEQVETGFGDVDEEALQPDRRKNVSGRQGQHLPGADEIGLLDAVGPGQGWERQPVPARHGIKPLPRSDHIGLHLPPHHWRGVLDEFRLGKAGRPSAQ